MNYLHRLIPLSLLVIVLLGCQDDTYYQQPVNQRTACIAPGDIGVADFIKTPDGMDGIAYVWESVDDAFGYDFELHVNGDIRPIISKRVHGETKIYVESLFEIDDVIEAKVRTVCDSKHVSEWVNIHSVNRNGGAAVDEIPSLADWNQVCNSSCNYMRFMDNEITKCNGEVINLGIGLAGDSYYLKSDICPCLFASDNLCEGLDEIVSCLTTPYLKRNYDTCN